jgi:hypothetical protein
MTKNGTGYHNIDTPLHHHLPLLRGGGFTQVYGVSFNSSGSLLAVASVNGVWLWGTGISDAGHEGEGVW